MPGILGGLILKLSDRVSLTMAFTARKRNLPVIEFFHRVWSTTTLSISCFSRYPPTRAPSHRLAHHPPLLQCHVFPSAHRAPVAHPSYHVPTIRDLLVVTKREFHILKTHFTVELLTWLP